MISPSLNSASVVAGKPHFMQGSVLPARFLESGLVENGFDTATGKVSNYNGILFRKADLHGETICLQFSL